MRASTLSAVAIGIAALVLNSATAATAGATGTQQRGPAMVNTSSVAAGSIFHGFKKKKGCGFTNGTTDAGDAAPSQDIYDFGIVTDAADDFTCARASTLKNVRWMGNYGASEGPPEWFDVYVYPDTGGEPSDTPMCSYTQQQYKATGYFVTPILTIKKLKGSACKVDAETTYWLEVRAHMAFGDGGQIRWEITSDLTGYPADWRNPDDGFGTGCTSFAQAGTGKGRDMQDCFGTSGMPDLIFSVK